MCCILQDVKKEVALLLVDVLAVFGESSFQYNMILGFYDGQSSMCALKLPLSCRHYIWDVSLTVTIIVFKLFV